MERLSPVVVVLEMTAALLLLFHQLEHCKQKKKKNGREGREGGEGGRMLPQYALALLLTFHCKKF